MGMQGPLTAQALGRSPYDEVVQGEGEQDPRQPVQQYDHRGRPINPETKRINRDIVRSHNEVMFVIGVVESESPRVDPEIEQIRRHSQYDTEMASKWLPRGREILPFVGLVGINCFRQRVLTYSRYSHVKFWQLYQESRRDYSISRDLLAGSASEVAAEFTHRMELWLGGTGISEMAWRCSVETLTWIRTHLEIHAAMQRLGLCNDALMLPEPSFFVPFTDASPIARPPPLEDLTLGSIVGWIAGAVIGATPFLAYVIARNQASKLRLDFWPWICSRLPSTGVKPRLLPPPPPPPPPMPTPYTPAGEQTGGQTSPVGDDVLAQMNSIDVAHSGTAANSQNDVAEALTARSGRNRNSSMPGNPPDLHRSQSGSGNPNEEFESDDEEPSGVNPTLISFDVEATEATDAPPGLWSAELRPSQTQEARPGSAVSPLYHDTLLTKTPLLLATDIFASLLGRLASAPYEAVALRLIAGQFCHRRDLPTSGILSANLLSGLNWTSVVNLVSAELLYFVNASNVWAVLTVFYSAWMYDDEEWKEYDNQVQQADAETS